MYMKFLNYTQTDKNIFWIASGYRPRNDGTTGVIAYGVKQSRKDKTMSKIYRGKMRKITMLSISLSAYV